MLTCIGKVLTLYHLEPTATMRTYRKGPHMLNNHEVNLTDEEAAAEVARVAKTYPVVRLLSADQIKSEPNCLLAGNRCPCLRQSSLEALAGSDDVSEQLLNDGTEYRARLRPLKVEGEPHVLLMVRPIDEQEAAEEDLVYTDVLTSVRNRRYYEEKLRSARMNAGVAVIDLDDFRVFNDTCGRHAGDLALGAVATAIRSGIRSTDELVRYGCDKFVVVMPNIPFPPMTSPVACIRCPMPFMPRLFRAMST